ncbi:LolA family protein [Pedobacter sp.]|uniref:LolA family protein n=1 Tax=Pedobacter sp. TaxID=1411316 RepID=UPI00396C8545
MKRIITALTFIAISCLSINVFAQKDPAASAILTKVSQKYRSLKSIKANFSLTLNAANGKVMDVKNGVLYAIPGTNKFKVDLGDQQIMSDGKTQWTYIKSSNEVQVSNVDPGSDAINPSKLFTIYEKGFKYIYAGDTKSKSGNLSTIELTPEKNDAKIFKIKLYIKKSNDIAKAEMFEKSGVRYTYNVSSSELNKPISNDMFTFDTKKYKGVEVVDLR